MSVKSRSWRIAMAAIVGLALNATLVSQSALADYQATTAPTLKPLFVVQVGDQSFSDAVAERAADNSEYRDLAKSWMAEWKKQKEIPVRGVADPTSREGAARAIDRAELQKLERALNTLNAPGTEGAEGNTNVPSDQEGPVTNAPTVPGTTPENAPTEPIDPSANGASAYGQRTTSAASASGEVQAAWADPEGPGGWPVRGVKGSGNTSWKEMYLIIEGKFCGSSCSVTDRMKIRVTINPGITKDMISLNRTYFPSAGNFAGTASMLFKSMKTATGGVTGNGSATAWSTTHTYTHGNGMDYSGRYLTVGAAMGVLIYPYGETYWDAAKTSPALCNSVLDPRCFY